MIYIRTHTQTLQFIPTLFPHTHDDIHLEKPLNRVSTTIAMPENSH